MLPVEEPLDAETRSQLQRIVDYPAFKDAAIVVMPDTHAGKGSVIGFTSPLGETVIPNIVGVDIGCGIDAYRLGRVEPDFDSFDKQLRQNIPFGHDVRNKPHKDIQTRTDPFWETAVQSICDRQKQDYYRVLKSIGTLGGGNHFIEIDRAPDGDLWLVIHSGSRNFGLQIATYHQTAAARWLKAEKKTGSFYRDLEYFPIDQGGQAYLDDMKTAQEYAARNRRAMARTLIEGFFKLDPGSLETVSSVHNYINFDDRLIRKGAISAQQGERLIIPLNMRDGTIIGTGKGNPRWNQSAPHGAGRLMSRTQARAKIDLDDFRSTMEGVWSSSVNERTLDEAPMAYKPSEMIIDAISETVDVLFIMKPVYNFKAD